LKSKFTNFKIIGIVVIFFLAGKLESAMGQITPDHTLGVESSTVNTGLVKGKNADIIGGGAVRGSSLLHSLKELNVLTNNGAYFVNPSSISNIIVRVTGPSKSSIFGTLGVLGNANLLLLNSNGVIFGPDSSLDLKGSFLASTASGIKFMNGYSFNTNGGDEPPAEPLYVPIELGFSNDNSNIEVKGLGHKLTKSEFGTPTDQGTDLGLVVGADQTLALVGGKVTFDGGIITSNAGQVQIGGIKSGNLGLKFTSQGLNLDFSKISSFGDINFLNKSLINENISNGLNIFGQNILLNNGSILWIKDSIPKQNNQATIRATDKLNIEGFAGVRSGFLSEAYNTNGSNLVIKAKSISLSDDGTLATVAFGNGKSGNIVIDTNSVNILGGGLIATSSFGAGDGGEIKINAINDISVDGYTKNGQQKYTLNEPDPIGIVTNTTGIGNSGNLIINSQNLNITNAGLVGTFTLGKGNGGNTTINVSNSIVVSGTNTIILSPSAINSTTFGYGDAGELIISSKDIFVLNGGRIDTSTLAYGNAGNLTIAASGKVVVDGFVPGVKNPSLIDSSANTEDPVIRELFRLPPFPTGNAGTLLISTPELRISNQGVVSVQNQGTGAAGSLKIKVGLLYLDNKGGIVGSTNSGNIGDINIQSDASLLRDRSYISTSSLGSGLGGNIVIKSGIFSGDSTSAIVASATSNQGGNISLTSNASLIADGFLFSTSSDLGPQFSGTTKINAPKVTLDSSSNKKISFQSSNYLNVVCNGSVANKQAEFINAKAGGFPPDYAGSLNGFSGWYDNQLLLSSSTSKRSQHHELNTDDIPEVQNIVVEQNGTVSLASSLDNGGSNYSQPIIVCR
jgi:filamentous hemagglutinin family protein